MIERGWALMVRNSDISCNSGLNDGTTDLLAVYVYTFEACIEGYASYNLQAQNGGSPHANLTCYGVSYGVGFSSANPPTSSDGNCWLKGSDSIPLTFISESSSAVSISNP